MLQNDELNNILNYSEYWGFVVQLSIDFGEVSERFKEFDSKSIVRQRTVGSNPTLSARE